MLKSEVESWVYNLMLAAQVECWVPKLIFDGDQTPYSTDHSAESNVPEEITNVIS